MKAWFRIRKIPNANHTDCIDPAVPPQRHPPPELYEFVLPQSFNPA